MKHVLPYDTAVQRRAGTNAAIEQPFAPLASIHQIRRPNLLLIHADDVRPELIGAYQSSAVATPNIDRLAKAGVRFTRVSGRFDEPAALSDAFDALRRGGYTTAAYASACDAETHITDRRDTGWAGYLRLSGTRGAVAEVDQRVGRLTSTLRRTNQYRRTAVLFIGAESVGGSPVPTLLVWPDQLPPRQRHELPVRIADWLPTLLAFGRCDEHSVATAEGVDLSRHLLQGDDLPVRTGGAERLAAVTAA